MKILRSSNQEVIVKRDILVVVSSLILILLLGGFLGVRTVVLNIIGEKDIELSEQQGENVKLKARIEELESELAIVPFTRPLESGVITSETGYRPDPMGGTEEALHNGIDESATVGTPVLAVRPGRVVEHWPPPGPYYKGHPLYGGYIVIQHWSRFGTWFTKYAHLSRTFVTTGDQVEQGQIIGLVGETGVATGPHLHFEVVVDPYLFLGTRHYADEKAAP